MKSIGIVNLPEASNEPVPVVIPVHGSAGMDSRYAFHQPALLEAGIGTFEVDFKTGVFTSLSDRSPMATFHPWAFGATGPTGAPILIFLGEKDSWNDPETCKAFCDELNALQPGVAFLTVYPEVYQ